MSAPAVTADPGRTPAPYSLLTRIAAETAGSFILVFIGLGALLYSGTLREIDPLINALAFGVALAAALGLFARISGGHVNPAISLGAAIKGQVSWADLPGYWLGQLVGAVAAAAVLYLTLPAGLSAQLQVSDEALFTQISNSFGQMSQLAQISQGAMSFSIPQVLVLEALATAVLTAVVLVAANRAGTAAMPVVAGLTLTGLILVLEPVTGGSANPARSTASALFAEGAALGQLWMFWLAPLIGGALAGLAYLLFAPPAVEVDEWADDEWDDEDGAEEASDSRDEAHPEEEAPGRADDDEGRAEADQGDDDVGRPEHAQGDQEREEETHPQAGEGGQGDDDEAHHEAGDAEDGADATTTSAFDPSQAEPVARLGEQPDTSEEEDPGQRRD